MVFDGMSESSRVSQSSYVYTHIQACCTTRNTSISKFIENNSTSFEFLVRVVSIFLNVMTYFEIPFC